MQQHKHFGVNNQGNGWFVGDLHGEYALLIHMLNRVGFNTRTDRLFAVGDLIDRGPDSLGCIRLLEEPWFYSVLGNHEQAVLMGLKDDELRARHRQIGGHWLDALSPAEIRSVASRIVDNMALAFTIDNVFGSIGVIHAEAPEHWLALDGELNWNTHLWSVNSYNRTTSGRSRPVLGIDAVVAGHVGAPYITTGNNQLWIDTLVNSGRLTLLKAQDVFGLIKPASAALDTLLAK